MPATSREEPFLRVSSANNEPITLRLEAGLPVTIQLVVDSTCTCAGTRAGSYTDTDRGTAG